MAIDLIGSAYPTDPAAGVAGLRTLGTGAQQAAAGNHSTAISSITATGTASSSTYLRGDGAWVTGAGAPAGTYWRKKSSPLGTVPVAGTSGTGFFYANGTFVAVNANGAGSCYSSTDGVTYTTRTLPTAVQYCGLSYGAGVFVAMGSSWVNNSTVTSVAASSPDGITWTSRTMPASLLWSSSAWNGSIFVAVGTATAGGATTVAASSPDGITWTSRTMPSNSPWTSVCWDGTKFVAIGLGISNTAVSTNGTSWSSGGTIGSAYGWAVSDGAGRVVALRNVSTVITVSTDHGASWGAGATVWSNASAPSGLWYANGNFYMADGAGNISYSSDGIYWSILPAPAPLNVITGLVYDGANIQVMTNSISGTYYG